MKKSSVCCLDFKAWRLQGSGIARMSKSNRECLARLALAFSLNIVVAWRASRADYVWTGPGIVRLGWMHLRDTLILGTFAAPALVFVVPVLWKGRYGRRGWPEYYWWFRSLGFLLLYLIISD